MAIFWIKKCKIVVSGVSFPTFWKKKRNSQICTDSSSEYPMTCPLYFLHIALFGKSSMDDVTSIMSQNCGERKTKLKGKCWYIYSRIGSSSITILLNFSPSLIRWQFGKNLTCKMTIWQDWFKICSSNRTHRIILHHYLCFKTFHECLTKMAALRGPSKSSCVIVCTYLPFVFLCTFFLFFDKPSLNLT